MDRCLSCNRKLDHGYIGICQACINHTPKTAQDHPSAEESPRQEIRLLGVDCDGNFIVAVSEPDSSDEINIGGLPLQRTSAGMSMQHDGWYIGLYQQKGS